jgi:hypothetical protein
VSPGPSITAPRQLSVDGHLMLGSVPFPNVGSPRIILVHGFPHTSLGPNLHRLPSSALHPTS